MEHVAGDARRAADEHAVVDALDGLAGQADDALDERHARLRAHVGLRQIAGARRVEDDHVTALGVGEPAEEARHEHAVALVDGRAHRPGRDAIRLDDVLLHEPRQPERDRDDHDELDQRPERLPLAAGEREPQLDPLGAPLALGRSGHELG